MREGAEGWRQRMSAEVEESPGEMALMLLMSGQLALLMMCLQRGQVQKGHPASLTRPCLRW